MQRHRRQFVDLRLCRLLLLFSLTIASDFALAASYERIDGTIVDPILNTSGGIHYYAGQDIRPITNLLAADLQHADLANASLIEVFLESANLTGANLSGANFTNADLSNADFSGAILANAIGLDMTLGLARYDTDTSFDGTGVDPRALGWILVPEPRVALLQLLGLGLLAARCRGAAMRTRSGG